MAHTTLSDSAKKTLASLIANGSESRPNISRATNLSKQTISLAMTELEGSGFVEANASHQGLVGRAALIYDVAPRAGWLLGIDMGSTHIRVAASTLTGHLILEQEHIVPDAPNTANADMASQAGAVVSDLIRRIGPLHGPLRSACLALSRSLIGLRNWQQEPEEEHPTSDLPEIIRQIGIPTEIPVYAENNVNCAAVGELRHGVAGGETDIAYLQVGVGLGAGIISGGGVLRGFLGQGGELRKLPLPLFAPLPGAAKTPGSQEALAARGLIGRYNLSRHGEGGSDAASSAEVFSRARAALPLAQAAIDDEARGIAYLASVLVATASPRLLLLGGGIGRNADLLQLVRDHLDRFGITVPIEHGSLGEAATVAGAAAIAAEQYLADLLDGHSATAISSYRSRWALPAEG
ncbi:ROK family protein [Subtercola sp. Z020]|uniref:ROK family protein n=1 Tax=Subtercola sp. Z020 TaxID=2080582 RepID=UPI0011B01B4C|nr:ROK family protein [Subtercola sp. Z020]